MRLCLAATLAFCVAPVLAPTTTCAQSPGAVEVVQDLTRPFVKAHTFDCLTREPRNPAVAGGVRQTGFFIHPKGLTAPARVAVTVALPAVTRGDRLLLAVDLGMSDGIVWTDRKLNVDGVRFVVTAAGRTVIDLPWRESGWQPCAADLTSHAGSKVILELQVHARESVAYDWAVVGRPRILRFRPDRAMALGRTNMTAGAVALCYRPGRGLKVTVAPIGAGEPVKWSEPAGAPREELAWCVLDVNMPKAAGTTIGATPRDAVVGSSALVGSYPPKLELTRLTCVQAVPMAGEKSALRAEVRNTGLGVSPAGASQITLGLGRRRFRPRPSPLVPPGGVWREEWVIRAAAAPRTYAFSAQLDGPAAPGPTARCLVRTRPAPSSRNSFAVANQHMRIEFVDEGAGCSYARVSRRTASTWMPVAVWSPLMRIAADSRKGVWETVLTPVRQTLSAAAGDARREASFLANVRDPDGVQWTATMYVRLDARRPLALVVCRWQPDKDRMLRAAWGPDVYVSDRPGGDAKHWALFPGLEHHFGPEVSSNPRDLAPPLNDRRTPDPRKVTVPIMAVTIGADAAVPPASPDRFYTPDSLKDFGAAGAAAPEDETTVALVWDPRQKWDGTRTLPSARFASPNSDGGQTNHRMALFLPSVPDYVSENRSQADRPVAVKAGQALTLGCGLVVTSGHALTALDEWLRLQGPMRSSSDFAAQKLPPPGAWPRTVDEALALCRRGFDSVWDAGTGKWSACVGWEPIHAPGFAALLTAAAPFGTDKEAASASAVRSKEVGAAIVRDQDGAGLASTGACHIMRYEFPFHYGHLAEAITEAERLTRGFIASQRPEGGWRFSPGSPQQADLGQIGDSVVGTNAHPAAMILRYARITGDKAALAAGEKALRFMERFRIPRGFGIWECPMYEPDQLAAAWVVSAYVDGWRCTGNPRWLKDAVYWAESGVPFVYLWSLPDRPGMLGATISNVGSTFYTISWLGLPVQWVGMTYAYHIQSLADALDASGGLSGATTTPLKPVLNLGSADWRRLAELITVSALHQQVTEGKNVGCYPDSYPDFRGANPPFINPEDILANVLRLKLWNPDVRTVRVGDGSGAVTISAAAAIEGAKTDAGFLRFSLSAPWGGPDHALAGNAPAPSAVTVDGNPLPRLSVAPAGQPGWWYNARARRLYLTTPRTGGKAEVQITF